MSTSFSNTSMPESSIFTPQDKVSIKTIICIFIIILIICFIMSSILELCQDSARIKFNQLYSECKHPEIENFSNDNLYAFSPVKDDRYQSIVLNAPELANSTGPSNLLLSQVERYVRNINNELEIRFDIYANLYVLGGNVFQSGKVPEQSYKVYLYNDNNEVLLGELNKDSDGIYKLKTISNDKSVLEYKNVKIVYKTNNKSEILLKGSFN